VYRYRERKKGNGMRTGQWMTVALKISGPVFEGEKEAIKKILF
jgi:hypothetical protein